MPLTKCFKYDSRLAVTSTLSELENIAGPLVDDCDEHDIERVDEIDDQLDERDRQEIEMLNLLFNAEFTEFTNRLSASKTKNQTLGPLSVPLECICKNFRKNSQLTVVKKNAIIWFLEHGVRRLSNYRIY
jgi:hypothetical protein